MTVREEAHSLRSFRRPNNRKLRATTLCSQTKVTGSTCLTGVFNTNVENVPVPVGKLVVLTVDITSVATNELPTVLTENGAFCLEMLLSTFVGNSV